MKELTSLLSLAMQRLSTAILSLTHDDLAKFVDPSFDVEIKITRRRSRDEAAHSVSEDLSSIVKKLTDFGSREEACDFLKSSYPTKKPLEQIARHLDIPIIKQDKIEALREKIIEGTTGARIRSEAIKGVD